MNVTIIPMPPLPINYPQSFQAAGGKKKKTSLGTPSRKATANRGKGNVNTDATTFNHLRKQRPTGKSH